VNHCARAAYFTKSSFAKSEIHDRLVMKVHYLHTLLTIDHLPTIRSIVPRSNRSMEIRRRHMLGRRMRVLRVPRHRRRGHVASSWRHGRHRHRWWGLSLWLLAIEQVGSALGALSAGAPPRGCAGAAAAGGGGAFIAANAAFLNQLIRSEGRANNSFFSLYPYYNRKDTRINIFPHQ
jgi:hypothetical protein